MNADDHQDQTTVLVIAGPTASGKSGLALCLAETLRSITPSLNPAIINADSMQVYRELRVLTARPEISDEAKADHHLYGYRSGNGACSVAAWSADAQAVIATLRADGRMPIVVGGTGLYLRGLLEGLAEIPPVPTAVRDEVTQRLTEIGGEAFLAELSHLDPETGHHIKPSDTQRLIRAREVFEATGRGLASWQRDPPRSALSPPTRSIILNPDRAALYGACDARFEQMMETGAVEEVDALVALGLPSSVPIMKAVGVREIAGWRAGEITRSACIAAAQQSSRRYAKRQMTWFRNQMKADINLSAQLCDLDMQNLIRKLRIPGLT